MTSIDGVSGTTTDTTSGAGGSEGWFEALARAWGAALDSQAQQVTDLANQIGGGAEQPSQVAELTAQSERLNFLANSEATSVNAVGQALETVARKQ
jgi:hypothetical protein